MSDLSLHEDAGIWCARLAEGPLDPSHQAALDAWLAADPHHRAALDDALALWNAMADVAVTPEWLSHRERALSSLRAAQRRRWRDRLQPYAVWVAGLAACLILAIGMAWMTARPTVYQTDSSHRRTLDLADGSRVELDASSRLEVRYAAHARRLTLVAGRAAFTVAHDPSRPFSVTAGRETVVATGTAFSVERLTQQVRVILFEGRVRVLHTQSNRTRPRMALSGDGRTAAAGALLTPGMQLLIPVADTAATAPDALALAQVTATDDAIAHGWESGQLDFDDEPLAIAVERVNRYATTTRLQVAPDATAVRISGTFNAGDTAAFTAGVTAAFPLRAVTTGDQVTFVKK